MSYVSNKSIFSRYFQRDKMLDFARKAQIDIYAKFPFLAPNTRYCKRLSEKKAPLILDAGCGEGEQISIIKKMLPQAKISAVDINKSPLLPDADVDAFHECNFNEDTLPFKDETFDYVYSQHVLEHLHNPIHFLKECERVLRPGGCLYVECPDVRWALLPHLPFITGTSGHFNFWDDPTHLRPWSRPALARAVMMAGFTKRAKTFYVRKFAHMLVFPLMLVSRNDDFKTVFLHPILGLWCGVLVEK